MIYTDLTPSNIFLDLDAKNSNEIFEIMGGNLIKQGYAKDSYIQALKDREKEFPTGIIMNEEGLAIALPHTSVDHVIKHGISIAVLKNSVDFYVMGGAEDEKCKVNLVFMLCVDDPNEHLETLQRIVEIFQDSTFLNKLSGVNSPEEVIEIFKVKEEELCQKK